jgi:hypothetical protein
MTNHIVLSGGKSCTTEMVGGKRRKYHKKSMKRRGSRKSKAMKKSRRHLKKIMKKGGSRKSRRGGSRKSRRGGSRKSRRGGSRKSRRGGSRKSRGAGMVQRAALPFGLLALQKMMHRRKSRKSLKKFGKRVLKAPYRTAKFLL